MIFGSCFGSDLRSQSLLVPSALKWQMQHSFPDRGERRAAARAQNEEEGRRVRQRLDDVEVRMDGMQSRIDQHEMRLGYLEAHIKVVLRGFDAVPEL